MSNEPTYATLQQAIVRIKERWPDAASWLELDKVAGLMPEDPASWETPLPEAARIPVKRLLERLPEPGDFIPGLRPLGICDL